MTTCAKMQRFLEEVRKSPLLTVAIATSKISKPEVRGVSTATRRRHSA